MKTLRIDDFDKLTKDELGCFALVTHDGSDQYVSDWNDILDCCYSEKGETWLTENTNTQILDEYYNLNQDIDPVNIR